MKGINLIISASLFIGLQKRFFMFSPCIIHFYTLFMLYSNADIVFKLPSIDYAFSRFYCLLNGTEGILASNVD